MSITRGDVLGSWKVTSVLGATAFVKQTKKIKTKRKPTWKSLFIKSPEWICLREHIFARDGHVCAECGQVGNHIDHILPASKYKNLALNPNNLRVLCQPCNFSKSAKVIPLLAEKHSLLDFI